jgi:hypothetical protein
MFYIFVIWKRSAYGLSDTETVKGELQRLFDNKDLNVYGTVVPVASLEGWKNDWLALLKFENEKDMLKVIILVSILAIQYLI